MESITKNFNNNDEIAAWVLELKPGTAIVLDDGRIIYKCDSIDNHNSDSGFFDPKDGKIHHFAEYFFILKPVVQH